MQCSGWFTKQSQFALKVDQHQKETESAFGGEEAEQGCLAA